MENKFIHLNVHSSFSVIKANVRTGSIVGMAKEYNMPAVALTDDCLLSGLIQFYYNAKGAGIKPILGLTSYLVPSQKSKKSVDLKRSATRITLLVKNEIGYKNLMRISSEASFIEGDNIYPRIDVAILEKHCEGIICLSGTTKELGLILKLQEIFTEDFFLEFQGKVFPTLLKIHNHYNIPIVATNDVHYLEKKNNKPSSIDRYFKTTEEMVEIFREHPGAIQNTVEIMNRCNFGFDYLKDKYPYFEIPTGETMDSYLKIIALLGLEKRYKNITAETKNRFEYELLVITKSQYSSYFLIVADLVNHAKNTGIPVGPGRGLVSGSLIAYVLGITDVDPIKYDLVFERFIDPNRIIIPEIFFDTCMEKKDKIFDYLKDKYGNDHFAYMFFPYDFDKTLTTALITKDPVKECIPTLEDAKNVYSQYSVESLLLDNYFTISFSGLEDLTIISKTINLIKEIHNKIIDINDIPLDDAKTFEFFCTGNLSNIFQMRQSGMQSFVRRIKPSCFDDILSIVSLYRFGPLYFRIDKEFANRKKGITTFKYLLPELEPILKSTYGVILYQEQLMQIASKIANFSLSEANLFRRVLGMKNIDKIKNQKRKFVEGAKSNNIPNQIINQIFDMLADSAEYLYLKAHAVPYTLITYQSAFLKTHYPTEFEAAIESTKPKN